jgi:hypothetical protein
MVVLGPEPLSTEGEFDSFPVDLENGTHYKAIIRATARQWGMDKKSAEWEFGISAGLRPWGVRA